MSKTRRRLAGGWHPLDRLPPRFFAAGEGSAASVPAFVPRRAGQAAQGGETDVLRQSVSAGWAVSAKPPFGGPETVPPCLSRCPRRAVISSHRLISTEGGIAAFRWKDGRIKRGDPLPGSGLPANHERGMKIMRLPTAAFTRRFLIRVLPPGFHRIRHARLLAGHCPAGHCKAMSRGVHPPPQDRDDPVPSRCRA
ncbi:transposase [Leisingera sp. M658]|nr:transposase [Leisingera sp. M658]